MGCSTTAYSCLVKQAMVSGEKVVFAVPTAGRAGRFASTIRSYAEHFRRHCVYPQIIVSNNDLDTACSRAYKDVIEVLRREYPDFEITYVDLDCHRELARRTAAKAGIPDAIALRLISDGCAQLDRNSPLYGSNRNAILAMTRGRVIVFADDDTLVKHGSEPSAVSPLPYFSMSEISFNGTGPGDAKDLNLLHEGIRHFEEIGVPEASHPADGLPRGTGARIVVTSFGSIGDSGWHDNLPLLLSAHEETLDYVSSLQNGSERFSSERIVRRSPSKSLRTPLMALMSMCMCLDNRVSLPCFYPCGRGEDDIFAATMRCLWPNNDMVHIAHMIAHSPDARQAIPVRLRISPQSLMVSIFDWAKLQGISTLPDVIAMLRDIDTKSESVRAERYAFFGTITLHSIANRLMQNLTSRPNGSASWKRYLIDLIFQAEELIHKLSRDPHSVISHFCGGVDLLSKKVDVLRESLEWWPRLMDATEVEQA